jgi:hypothetical protein
MQIVNKFKYFIRLMQIGKELRQPQIKNAIGIHWELLNNRVRCHCGRHNMMYFKG